MNKLAAEFFGTFALVFAGTGAIVINDVTGGAVAHAGIALPVCRLNCPARPCEPLSSASDARDQNGSDRM